MKKELLLLTIFGLLLVLVIILCMALWGSNSKVGLTMYQCPTYTGGQILNELRRQLGINITSDPKNADIYLPCGYTMVENELKNYNPQNTGQVILAIDGCDQIVSKNGLWKTLSNEYGIDIAAQLVPKSYITTVNADMQRLQNDYNPNKIYIMKKNIQRQQGLKITQDLNEMLRGGASGYVVIQEYLMNPLLFDGRKFDIRVYLLVIQKGNQKEFYRHKGGRCHYTRKQFTPHNLDKDIHIPSGYNEDQEFKASHPETLQELRDYLNKRSGCGDSLDAGNVFFNRLDQMLLQCCKAFSKVIGTQQKFSDKDTVQCQLFGLDILSDSNLRPVLIEINKGPEMSWSSDTELKYKKKLVVDMFNLLGYESTPEENDFIKLA